MIASSLLLLSVAVLLGQAAWIRTGAQTRLQPVRVERTRRGNPR